MLYPSLKTVALLHYQAILVLYQVCDLNYSVNKFLRIFNNSYEHNASLPHFNPKQQKRVDFLLNFLHRTSGGTVETDHRWAHRLPRNFPIQS